MSDMSDPGYGDYASASYGALTTEQYTAIIVGGALVLLWLLSHGWRGVSVGGVSVGIK